MDRSQTMGRMTHRVAPLLRGVIIAVFAVAALPHAASGANDPAPSPLFRQSLETSLHHMNERDEVPIQTTHVEASPPVPVGQAEVADTAVRCIYTLICMSGNADTLAMWGLEIGVLRAHGSCYVDFDCSEILYSVSGSVCLAWKAAGCAITDIPPIPGTIGFFGLCDCESLPTIQGTPTCRNATCISGGTVFSCQGEMSCPGVGPQTMCSGSPTCVTSGQPTCDGGGSTCETAPTCAMFPTCPGRTTCGTATCSETCARDVTCSVHLSTCPGYVTCGGATCDGSGTCEGATCLAITCTGATCDSSPTCGGEATCSGQTCSDVTCYTETCAALPTCGGAFTCEGPTCSPHPTCLADTPTCTPSDTALACIYELICMSGNPDTLAMWGLEIGARRAGVKCSSEEYDCLQHIETETGSICLIWRYIGCGLTDLPAIPLSHYTTDFPICDCTDLPTLDRSPTCDAQTCRQYTCMAQTTCPGAGSITMCLIAPTCGASSTPTCYNSGVTCGYIPSCAPVYTCGGWTCAGTTTCNTATCPQVSTCGRGVTCLGLPTCEGSGGGETCDAAATCDYTPTCSQFYNTCLSQATCAGGCSAATYSPYPTCALTCTGTTCPPTPTCGSLFSCSRSPTCVSTITCSGVSICPLCNCPHQGDLNDDGRVDAADIVALARYLFGQSEPPAVDAACAHSDRGDLDCDQIHSILDAVALVDHVFHQRISICDPCTGQIR